MKGGDNMVEVVEQPQEKPAKAAPKKAAPKRKAPVKKQAAAKPKGKTMRPEALAKELGMKNGKQLRAWLRKNHTRKAEAKNTAWEIPANVVAEARKAFAKDSK